MNKLKLITSALLMCGLVGTAYAGDPNILPLNSPILPLHPPAVCSLKISSAWASSTSFYQVTITDSKNNQLIAPFNTQGSTFPLTTTFFCEKANYFQIHLAQYKPGKSPVAQNFNCTQDEKTNPPVKNATCMTTYTYWSQCFNNLEVPPPPSKDKIMAFILNGVSGGNQNMNLMSGGSKPPADCPENSASLF